MAMSGVGIKDVKDVSVKIYHALMGDAVTTLLLIGMPFIEVFIPRLTWIMLGLALFFGVRSTIWKFANDKDERRVKGDIAVVVSAHQVKAKEIQLEQDKIQLEKDKFQLKRDVIVKQENMRGQILKTRLTNLETRNKFACTLTLSVNEKQGALSNDQKKKIEHEFKMLSDEAEFLITDGLTSPFEELFIDKKTSVPIATSFQVTEDKFKQINIGEVKDE